MYAEAPADEPSPESDPSARSPAAGSRRWLTFLLALACACCAGLLTAFYRARDPLPPLTEADFAAAKVRWKENGPASYVIRVKLGGSSPGEFVVRVENGRVAEPPQRNGIPVSGKHTWETWTVAGQFETIERELELAADPEHEMNAAPGTKLRLGAVFDPHYGYPARYRRLVQGGPGPEVAWTVESFEPANKSP